MSNLNTPKHGLSLRILFMSSMLVFSQSASAGFLDKLKDNLEETKKEIKDVKNALENKKDKQKTSENNPSAIEKANRFVLKPPVKAFPRKSRYTFKNQSASIVDVHGWFDTVGIKSVDNRLVEHSASTDQLRGAMVWISGIASLDNDSANCQSIFLDEIEQYSPGQPQSQFTLKLLQNKFETYQTYRGVFVKLNNLRKLNFRNTFLYLPSTS